MAHAAEIETGNPDWNVRVDNTIKYNYGVRTESADKRMLGTPNNNDGDYNFRKAGTTLNQALFLRGVGTINFSIAAEPSVAAVLDGVVLSRAGEGFTDLFDVERIEVLRGPQGTLFGKNASAGVINITTQMPKNEFGGSVEASYFDRNEFRLKGAVNVPLVQDTLALRVTVSLPRAVSTTCVLSSVRCGFLICPFSSPAWLCGSASGRCFASLMIVSFAFPTSEGDDLSRLRGSGA